MQNSAYLSLVYLVHMPSNLVPCLPSRRLLARLLLCPKPTLCWGALGCILLALKTRRGHRLLGVRGMMRRLSRLLRQWSCMMCLVPVQATMLLLPMRWGMSLLLMLGLFIMLLLLLTSLVVVIIVVILPLVMLVLGLAMPVMKVHFLW